MEPLPRNRALAEGPTATWPRVGFFVTGTEQKCVPDSTSPRRSYLASAASALLAGVAGCTDAAESTGDGADTDGTPSSATEVGKLRKATDGTCVTVAGGDPMLLAGTVTDLRALHRRVEAGGPLERVMHTLLWGVE